MGSQSRATMRKKMLLNKSVHFDFSIRYELLVNPILIQGQWHWHVKDLKNGLHLIQNVKYERYANCGSRASLNADVMGASQKQEWHIQAIGSEGEYTYVFYSY
jgi:hypothetical protein